MRHSLSQAGATLASMHLHLALLQHSEWRQAGGSGDLSMVALHLPPSETAMESA